MHLGYWLLFAMLLLVFVLISFQSPVGSAMGGGRFFRLMLPFVVIPSAAGFYLGYVWLFPRFVLRRAWGMLTLGAGGGAVVAGMLGAAAVSVVFGPGYMFYAGWHSATTELLFMAALAFVQMAIGLVLRGFVDGFAQAGLKDALLAQNAQMELALLRAQINPHFLFNTINNIDVLIDKDPHRASGYLNQLSDILRFMLFETKAPHIPLSQEITYIEKYLELQKIRFSNPDFVQLRCEGDLTSVAVPPMLFMPFIENAFKHSENKNAAQGIRLSFAAVGGEVRFECINFYEARPAKLPEAGGLGQSLIRRRLELLYPGKHTLHISDEAYCYRVDLTLPANAT